ncbi:predicted protein [Verticillium alfalfae VaMs.102]|uniref:Predicted protein n=1 Tax=Verticillium alfalfae (strain VaMs.102 / ATCC MYA-4576 / FGSC 10136) TaxID=526221 RepID=C9SX64_VERA1|nr:predicted protein [Verticillium alfalfae VaMs.102]EEY23254.1 predicted protein [Verticillium alfalfae VaMs.102]
MKHITALHRGWPSLDQDWGPPPEWPPPHLTMTSRKGLGEAALGNLIGRNHSGWCLLPPPLPSSPEVLRLAATPQWYDKRERGVPATACQGRHVRNCLRHKLRRLYAGAVLTLSFRVSGLEI